MYTATFITFIILLLYFFNNTDGKYNHQQVARINKGENKKYSCVQSEYNKNIQPSYSFYKNKTKVLKSVEVLQSCNGLDLSNNNISFINHNVFYSIKSQFLNLSNNKITTLHSHTFSTNFELKYLLINNNELDNLNDNQLLFSNLTNLTDLHLEYNQIHIIPEKLFLNTKNLKRLYLNNNIFLYQLHDNCFSSLKLLEDLHLEHNRINNISINLFKNTVSLQELHLDFNEIKYLNNYVFQSLKNLKILTLNENCITQLYTNTFKNMVSLSSLTLSHNKIDKIKSKIFEDNRSLTKILLNNNDLMEIKDEIFDELKNLKHLDLSNNLLSTLPNISTMFQFETFLFYNNRWNCNCLLYYLFTWWSKNDQKQNTTCFTPQNMSWNQLSIDYFTCKPPIVKIYPEQENYVVVEGDTITLSCVVTAFPTAYQNIWKTKDDRDLVVFIYNKLKLRLRPQQTEYGAITTVHNITISNITAIDWDKMECICESRNGDNENEVNRKSIILQVRVKEMYMGNFGYYTVIGFFLLILLLLILLVKYVIMKILAEKDALNYDDNANDYSF